MQPTYSCASSKNIMYYTTAYPTYHKITTLANNVSTFPHVKSRHPKMCEGGKMSRNMINMTARSSLRNNLFQLLPLFSEKLQGLYSQKMQIVDLPLKCVRRSLLTPPLTSFSLFACLRHLAKPVLSKPTPSTIINPLPLLLYPGNTQNNLHSITQGDTSQPKKLNLLLLDKFQPPLFSPLKSLPTIIIIDLVLWKTKFKLFLSRTNNYKTNMMKTCKLFSHRVSHAYIQDTKLEE